MCLMTRPRGLNNRLCPKCKAIAPHRTLYVRTTIDGKIKWFRLFWACTGCSSLNHVVVPKYTLASVPPTLPSAFVASIVDTLRGGPLDFDELILRLRKHCAGVRHVFNPDVTLAMEYLKGHGIVTEQIEDLTERNLSEIRARTAGSTRLGFCPVEEGSETRVRSLITMYSQRWPQTNAHGNPASHREYSAYGVLCLSCLYYRLDVGLTSKPQS
jgi:hypothetical protein